MTNPGADDAFTMEAIARDERDRERYEAGRRAGYEEGFAAGKEAAGEEEEEEEPCS